MTLPDNLSELLIMGVVDYTYCMDRLGCNMQNHVDALIKLKSYYSNTHKDGDICISASLMARRKNISDLIDQSSGSLNDSFDCANKLFAIDDAANGRVRKALSRLRSIDHKLTFLQKHVIGLIEDAVKSQLKRNCVAVVTDLYISAAVELARVGL